MLLFADGLQGVIELLQILLSVVFQFDPALALAGDDPDLAAETGREVLFTFRQIIHLRRLGLGGLRGNWDMLETWTQIALNGIEN